MIEIDGVIYETGEVLYANGTLIKALRKLTRQYGGGIMTDKEMARISKRYYDKRKKHGYVSMWFSKEAIPHIQALCATYKKCYCYIFSINDWERHEYRVLFEFDKDDE